MKLLGLRLYLRSPCRRNSGPAHLAIPPHLQAPAPVHPTWTHQTSRESEPTQFAMIMRIHKSYKKNGRTIYTAPTNSQLVWVPRLRSISEAARGLSKKGPQNLHRGHLGVEALGSGLQELEGVKGSRAQSLGCGEFGLVPGVGCKWRFGS